MRNWKWVIYMKRIVGEYTLWLSPKEPGEYQGVWQSTAFLLASSLLRPLYSRCIMDKQHQSAEIYGQFTLHQNDLHRPRCNFVSLQRRFGDRAKITVGCRQSRWCRRPPSPAATGRASEGVFTWYRNRKIHHKCWKDQDVISAAIVFDTEQIIIISGISSQV